MAGIKQVVFLVFLGCCVASVLCSTIKSEKKLSKEELERKRDALLSSLVANLSKQVHSRVRRYVKPDWKNHPLYPLYPIDYPVCENRRREEKSGLCRSWSNSGFCRTAKFIMKKYCKKECGYCKAPAPPACQSSTFGCCWDNTKARGANGRGCHPCFDMYSHTCRQFDDYCHKEGRNGRFIRYHCFSTCGLCAMAQGGARKH